MKSTAKDAGHTIIYVFSGTGTSLAMAKRIAGSLGNAELRLIPSALEKAENGKIRNEASVVGLVFPNYFGGIPDVVTRFIRVLDLERTDYIFSVVTGGKSAGLCFEFLETELKEKGKHLNYGKRITGISNYIVAWYYKLVFKTGDKQEKVLQEMDEKADRYSKEIAGRKNEVEKSQRLAYFGSRLLSSKKLAEDTRPWDKEFSIGENCIGCGTCEKVCQFDNIEIIDGKPVFQHNCQRCLACIHYCPKAAIGFKGKPMNRPRYHHPEYPAEEFIRITNSSR